jgi:N-acetylneuraminic acid mutarotase
VRTRLKTSAPRIFLGSALLVGLSSAAAVSLGATARRAGSTRASVPPRAPESLVATLREGFPALHPRLRVHGSFERTTWRQGNERIEGLRARPESVPGAGDGGAPLDVVFPARASGPVVAEGEGVRVVVRPRGARPSLARTIDGKLVYRGVYPETDSLHVIGDRWTEEYLYLRSADAPVRFEHDVLETSGVSSVRIENGQVHFRGADGRGLVIPVPVVVDVAGRRSTSAARWAFEGEDRSGAGRLVLRLDPAGLEYPLVVDPSWITTGSLGVARADGVGILLQDATVLVMGRDPQAELYDIASGTWSPTGPGWPGRASYAAVLLRDGRVLATGGYDASGSTTFADCHLYDPVAGAWSPAASMSTPRRNHTATLLGDGRVLVVGGEDAATHASAEIYDPATNTWSPTSSLSAGKARHSATLLRDGRVMVTGGATGGGGILTGVTEIYDPAGPSWTVVPPLAPARAQHTATLLPDGTVLVVGGLGAGALASVEIFDPSGPTWVSGPGLSSARYDHSATLLPRGHVLVTGGTTPFPLATAEIYDPTGPSWTAAPNMSTARFRHSATMLPDGRVLVAGGFEAVALATCELYDNDVPAWTAVPNMNVARNESTATLLRDGRVLVAGGEFLSSAEVFDPKAVPLPTWTPTANTMGTTRWRHSATLLLDGRVLVAGSRASTGASRTADVYDPALDTWSATSNLVVGRSSHIAALLPDGEVLIAGGQENNGNILASAERFDPATDTWRSTTSMGTVRWRPAATLLRDGRVLVTGGFELAALDTAEIYAPSGETWTPVPATMTVPRYYHTSTLLPSGRVLLVGGGTSPASAELFDPTSGTFTATGNPVLAHDTDFTATLLANGRVLVVGGIANPQAAEVYDPVTGTWAAVPSTIGQRATHAAALLPDGRVLAAGSLPIGPTAEVYDVGRGEDPAWRPVLATVTDPLTDGAPLVATGSQFQGLSEAAAGIGSMHSATNYPLVQLRRIDNEDVRWLLVDAAAGWSDIDFTSLPLTGVVPGPALVTVFTNGIPSDSRLVNFGCSAPVITSQPTGLDVCLGSPASFSVGTTAQFPTYQWRKDGTPLVDGGPVSGVLTSTLTINPTALADAGSYDVVVSNCSTADTTSVAVPLTVSVALSSVSASLSGSSSVCTTCVGGTATESHTDGGPVTHQWGYRTTSGGPITDIPGQTGPSYVLNGSDFPGPGSYFLVVRTTPLCGPTLISNEIGVTVTLSAPGDDVAFFTVTSRSTENVLEWVNPAGYNTVSIHATSGPTCTPPSDPLNITTWVADEVGLAGQRDRFPHGGLTNDVTYCYTLFVDTGGGYSAGRSNRGRPMKATDPVKWAFSTGVFTLTAPTVSGAGVIATSNDYVVHSVERGPLPPGGEWPASWLPVPVDGPIQSRSPVVPITVNGANPVVFLGTLGGSIYAIDAVRGATAAPTPWSPASTSIAPEVQAAPAGIFSAFGGTYDYLLVGTRQADNALVALDPLSGAELDRFENVATPIGVINAMASVDYSTKRVYFTSFEHPTGSTMTLWALQLGNSPIFTPAWPMPRALGSIESSPVLMGDSVYVGTPLGVPTGGTLYAVDAASGNPGLDRTFYHGDGQVKDFVFPDWRNSDLYFATDSFVWALHDDESMITNQFPSLPPPGGIELAPGVVPTSGVLFVPGSHYLYVGGSDGQLYEIDLLGAPDINSVTLGDGLATVGSPSLDRTNNLVLVGTEAGVFYAVAVPLP